jgi:hypothetical protein
VGRDGLGTSVSVKHQRDYREMWAYAAFVAVVFLSAWIFRGDHGNEAVAGIVCVAGLVVFLWILNKES